MRNRNAHRAALALSGALAVAVVVTKWHIGGLSLDWVVLVVLIGLSSASLAVGFALRERALDEPVVTEVLSAYEASLNTGRHRLTE